MNIQIVAPSACVDEDAIRLAQQQLKQFNCNAILSEHIFAQHRYLAGSIEQRIYDLKMAATNPHIDAIWCARGGTGAAQLTPYLDDWILNKPILGYSDSTVLLNFVAMQGGQAIHAPVFQEIASKNLAQDGLISLDAQETLSLISQNTTLQRHYPIVQNSSVKSDPQEIIKGKILGGNLATLCSLQGTNASLNLNQPTILLLEDVGEPYYRLERLLVQLLQSIDTDRLKALVIGDFYNCPQKNVPQSISEIFNEYLEALNVPLFSADWFGHGKKNRPFWIGTQGTIQDNQLTIN